MAGRRIPFASLYSSCEDPSKGFPSYCASTSPDWTGQNASQWPGRHCQVCEPFRDGRLKPEKVADGRGRALFSGVDVAAKTSICELQQPLSVLQYADSQSICEVCAYCHRFVGSLGSAIRRTLSTTSQRPEDLVADPSMLDELEAGQWQLRDRLCCANNCGAVFCSHACLLAGKSEGWHRVLCIDLEPARRNVWPLFLRHAKRHNEQFVAAAKVIAEIICLVRHSSVALYEAMAYFSRYAKMSWVNMLSLPCCSSTQAMPKRGKLAEMALAKKEKRLEVLTDSMELLAAMLWEKEFDELLTIDFYSHLLGQFSLSNAWVQVEHPLLDQLLQSSEDTGFKSRFRNLFKATTAAVKEVLDDEKAPSKEPPSNVEEPEPEQGCEDEPWQLPRYEASALYPCIALSNHSCRPNYSMRYSDGALATMVANRDIAAGEELNLAYISPSYDLNERLVGLWRNWGFVCTCKKCQDELMARAVQERSASRRSIPDSEASDSDNSRSESSSGFEGCGRTRQFAQRTVPDSVRSLEADLRQMMQLMEAGESDPD